MMTGGTSRAARIFHRAARAVAVGSVGVTSAAVLAASGPVATPTDTAAEMAAQCPRYLVYVVRGSGEAPQPLDWHGKTIPDTTPPSPQAREPGEITKGLGSAGLAFATAFADAS